MLAAHIPREIELKFEIDATDVAKARVLLDTRFGAPSRTRTLTSVYYDTPAQDLAAAGVTLRVRSDGSGCAVQTVKRSEDAPSALFDRDEWETSLQSQDPDLQAFVDTPAGATLAAISPRLAPLFETVVHRTVVQVAHGTSLIEVALDEGHVIAGGRSQPLAELELELKQGSVRDLFGLMRAFEDIDSLRPGVLTKSERGYLLVRDRPECASKAEPLRLSKHLSTGEAFRAIVQACLRHFGLNAPLVIRHRSPEALHQARVALRRLRSALSLFKTVAGDGQYKVLNAELQAVSRVLGQARNLDVFIARRAETERRAGEPESGASPDRLEQGRVAAYDEVVACLRSSAFYALLRRLVEWAEIGAWTADVDPVRLARRDRSVRRFAADVLGKQHRRVTRHGRHLAELHPQARHRVRIEAKKLRYASEFFAGLARRPKALKRHRRFVAALVDLQDALGQLNDIETEHDFALSFVEATPSGNGPGPTDPGVAFQVGGHDDARSDALLRAAERAHARLAEAKPFWSSWSA